MNSKQAKGQVWLTESQEIEVFGDRLKDGYRGDARSHFIYHIKQYDKIPMKFSCKTKSPAKAYRFAPAEVAKRLKSPEELEAEKPRNLISDEVERYKASRQKEVESAEIDPKTFAVIRRSLEPVSHYFGSEFPEIFEDENWTDKWDAFCEHWRANNKGETMFNIVKYTIAFTRYLHERGIIKTRPKIYDRHAKKEKLRLKKRRQKIYSIDEVTAIYGACETLAEKIITRLGYENAFRIDDGCSLKKDQINTNPEDPYIQFEGEDKASTFVRAPISQSLLALIASQLAHLESEGIESDYLFPQVRTPSQPIKPAQLDFTRVIRRAGVKWGTHHILRHTRLTLDFGNPNIPQLMVVLLRRCSLRTALEHYIHPNEQDRKNLLSQARGLVQ